MFVHNNHNNKKGIVASCSCIISSIWPTGHRAGDHRCRSHSPFADGARHHVPPPPAHYATANHPRPIPPPAHYATWVRRNFDEKQTWRSTANSDGGSKCSSSIVMLRSSWPTSASSTRYRCRPSCSSNNCSDRRGYRDHKSQKKKSHCAAGKYYPGWGRARLRWGNWG